MSWTIEGTLTLGTLTAFLTYVQRFFQPIENFSDQYTLMQSAMAAAERVFHLLDQRPEIRDIPNPSAHPTFQRRSSSGTSRLHMPEGIRYCMMSRSRCAKGSVWR